jgi:hypothetical protein
MSDRPSFDADIDQAWVEFRGTLADRLADFTKGQSLVLTCIYDVIHPSPHVVFSVTGANRLRCEIPAGQRLDVMDIADLDALVAAGWRSRKNGRYVLEVGRRLSDKVAALAVVLLRDLWEVPHPAFLSEEGPHEPAPIVAVKARGRDHLRELAAAAVSDLMSKPVVVDEHGDIALSIGVAPSWLCVREDAPTLEFVVVLGDATNGTAVIAKHGPRWPDVSITVVEGTVVGVLRLESTVFAVKNLTAAFARWIEFMREGAPAVVADLAVDPDLPRALMVLLHLDPDGEGLLDAHEVAAVCDYDRDAILDFLRLTSEQEISWRESAAEADDLDEAAACLHEADAWGHTHENLRAALRVVVLPKSRGVAIRRHSANSTGKQVHD